MKAAHIEPDLATAPVLPEPIALSLSPKGHVLLRAAFSDEPALDANLARRICNAFEVGEAAGLLHLGAVEVATPLPPAFGFWRDFARMFVASLCGTAEIEAQRDRVDVPIRRLDLEALARSAPPMEGGEYITVDVLEAKWGALLGAWRSEVRSTPGTVQEILARKNSAWHVVGRVHFHLAENKRNQEHPFAFLATYTTGLSAQGNPQHRPLGHALRESSSVGDKSRLLALLLPVKKAAEKSDFLKELVDSGHIFQPLSWTPRDAHRFLQHIPAFEQSGVVVRVPDWWKAHRPPRPRVTVSVGNSKPSVLGLSAILDFSVKLTLDGEEISEAELRALRVSSDGLTLLKGKWVEVDREKLDQVLEHWKAVERRAHDGVSFIEGMRLLSGAPIGEEVAQDAEVVSSWFGVQAGPWLSEVLESLSGPQALDDLELGQALRAKLRPYQREGVKWLRFLSSLRLGACLADDMGLGKTIQVLGLLLFLKERAAIPGPHLLVVPASLLANWKSEAERFAPSLRFLVAHPSAMSQEELAELADRPSEKLRTHDVVMVSYGSVPRYPWVTSVAWGLVILDEAQAIKNPGSKQTRAVKTIKSQCRVVLTGTPIENHLTDLWSLFDFLNPGLLGSAKEFARFVKRSSVNPYGGLRELVRPYILRRLKTDRSVIADLPEKTEVRAFCSLSKRQAALYQESVDSLAREVAKITDEPMRRRGLILAYLVRFKQICNHPSQWLADGAYQPEESGKYARLRELCEVVASRQEKALIFTQFREITAPLAAYLGTIFGRPGLVLSGETPVKQRPELVRRFQEDEAVPFFVLSLKAGGTGLNLTAASHVIHFDRWWNPAVENQATDRAFRIGQKKSVIVHKFICRGTIEERIDEMIESKQGMSRDLLEGSDEIKLTEMSDRQLLELVSLDIHSARDGD